MIHDPISFVDHATGYFLIERLYDCEPFLIITK